MFCSAWEFLVTLFNGILVNAVNWSLRHVSANYFLLFSFFCYYLAITFASLCYYNIILLWAPVFLIYPACILLHHIIHSCIKWYIDETSYHVRLAHWGRTDYSTCALLVSSVYTCKHHHFEENCISLHNY